MHDVHGNHRILVEEIGGVMGVRQDPANPCRSDENNIRPRNRHPFLCLALTRQIKLGVINGNEAAFLLLQPPHQGGTDHAGMSGNPDPFAPKRETVPGHLNHRSHCGFLPA